MIETMRWQAQWQMQNALADGSIHHNPACSHRNRRIAVSFENGIFLTFLNQWQRFNRLLFASDLPD
jgi:hypothetical protein